MPKDKSNAPNGGNRDDILDGGGGSAALRGGRGNDLYIIDDLLDTVEEKTNGGDDTVMSSIDYTLGDNVEALTLDGSDDLSGYGNELDNLLNGNAGSNLLSGGDGADTMDGGAGDDTLLGDAGDDLFLASPGDDTVLGGDGSDTIIYSGSSNDYDVTRSGEDIIVTGAGWADVLSGVETLVFDDATILSSDVEPTQDLPPLPSAEDDVAIVAEDGEVMIDLLANDRGEMLSITSVSAAKLGALSLGPNGALLYRPFENMSGNEVISYTATDDLGRSVTANVFIDVLAMNDDPEAVLDRFMTDADMVLAGEASVLDNDTDVDGDTLAISACDTETAAGGTVEMAEDGTFTYRPADGFVGTDSFSYTVSDGAGGESSTVVEIDVIEVAPPAPAEPDPAPDPDPNPLPVVDTAPPPPPYYVEALLFDDDSARLNWPNEVGTPVTVTYAYLDAAPSYIAQDDPRGIHETFVAFTGAQRDATEAALDAIEGFAGITFVQVDSPEEATITFGTYEMGDGMLGIAAPAFGGSIGDARGDVYLNSLYAGEDFTPGSEMHMTLLHEIGHAMGLDHAHLTGLEETQPYTVMGTAWHPYMTQLASTFQMYDIAALQHLYGTGDATTQGDDVYDTASLFDQVKTIWDGGGHDTLDLSEATAGVTLDLNEGAFSTVASAGAKNIALAFGTTIEDAVGTRYDDVLIGNASDNVLVAGAGDDTLSGGDGADTFGLIGGGTGNLVEDFVRGEDRIDLSGAEFTIEDLFIDVQEDGLHVSWEGGGVVVKSVENLDEEDFVF